MEGETEGHPNLSPFSSCIGAGTQNKLNEREMLGRDTRQARTRYLLI